MIRFIYKEVDKKLDSKLNLDTSFLNIFRGCKIRCMKGKRCWRCILQDGHPEQFSIGTKKCCWSSNSTQVQATSYLLPTDYNQPLHHFLEISLPHIYISSIKIADTIARTPVMTSIMSNMLVYTRSKKNLTYQLYSVISSQTWWSLY